MFYVYHLADPRDGRPFYIGKGKKKRAWSHTKCVQAGGSTGNPRKDAIIEDLLRVGLEPEVKIIAEYDDEAEAFEHEIELIATIPRLTNIRKGGEGFALSPDEAKKSAEFRKLRQRHKKHLRTRAWLRDFYSRASTWGGWVFPDIADGERKAQEFMAYLRETLALPDPPPPQRVL